MSDGLSTTSKEKQTDLQMEVLKLQNTIDDRESELARMQMGEYKLKRKCEKLLDDGIRCSHLEMENKELQRALKVQRNRLLGIRSNKKQLKKKNRELAIVESKCARLEMALKKSKFQIFKLKDTQLKDAQEHAKKLEADAVQEELTSLEQLAAEEDETVGVVATILSILPRYSARLITISVSVSIFTSFFVFRYMY